MSQVLILLRMGTPNGWRYPLVGGMKQRHSSGNNFKPHELPENAQTPTRRVHAVLGAFGKATFSTLQMMVCDIVKHRKQFARNAFHENRMVLVVAQTREYRFACLMHRPLE